MKSVPDLSELQKRAFPRCGNVLYQPLDSGLRRNDDEAIDADRQPYSLNPCLLVIYGQEVLYAASFRWNDDGGKQKYRGDFVISKSAPSVTAGLSARRNHPGFFSQVQVGPRENPRAQAAPRSPAALFRADI